MYLPTRATPPSPTSTTIFATRRPWRELVKVSAFIRPTSIGEATSRIKRNLCYFRVNYAMIILFVLFVSLLWHPLSMIVFLIIFVAWFFLFFYRDQPLIILHRPIDDRLVLGLLSVITILGLVFTDVWLNVLVSVLIGVLIVVLHSVIRGTEDLYFDEQDFGDGGLSSVVGSPTRTGYTRI